MADSKTSSGGSSGRAAQDPPQSGRPSERATRSSSEFNFNDSSFTDHFGEYAETQDRVILDRSVIVERDGDTVLTDNPQPGDLPQGVADRKNAENQAAGNKFSDQESKR